MLTGNLPLPRLRRGNRCSCPLRDLRGRELGQLGGFKTSRCLRSGSRPLAMTVKIGTSVGSAGALDDVECRDRTAKTPQFQVSEVFEPCYRFDRFSDAAADQDLPVLGLSTKPGGEVAYRAGRGVAGVFGKPDLAQSRVALCDTRAETQFGAKPTPPDIYQPGRRPRASPLPS
jgi:hypothetical protein